MPKLNAQSTNLKISPTTPMMTNNTDAAYTLALLRSLNFSGIKFLRYFTIDACGSIRCKAQPIEHLLASEENLQLKNQVSVAAVCYAGMPYYADMILEGSGMSARNMLKIQPDIGTLRILPYAPKTAMVMGSLFDQYTSEPSPYCTRGLLASVIEDADERHNVSFSVGVELEFCLVDAKNNQPVDRSVFANSVTMNDQEPFLSDLHDFLKQQYIPVEVIHAESGPGQVEVVLKYSNNPLTMADNILFARETIRSVARNHGMKAIFTPKYNMTQAGNGLHFHLSIRNATTGEPIFCDGNSLTEIGGSFVEGLLMHLEALLALTMPTVNSFRRVGPGCWTGSRVGWALEDKESAVRLCSNLATQETDNVELKVCDNTCNVYLALAGILAAGVDGLDKGVGLRSPLDDDTNAPSLPDTLPSALERLSRDERLMTLLGPQLSQAYLAVRRNEAQRAMNMTLEDEVKEFVARA